MKVSSGTLLSIVIPIYNTGSLLSDCLDSILTQITSDYYEVICVDDGSTDNSAARLEAYQAKYPAVKVFHQENRGAASAKNVGIQKAKGTYIWIINSDDCVKCGSLECILRTLAESAPDALKIRLRNIPEDVFAMDKVLEKQAFQSNVNDGFIFPPTDDVTTIFRADIIRKMNISFLTDMKYHYDRLFGVLYYSHIEQSKIFTIAGVVYLRRQRKQSEMGQMSYLAEAKNRYYADSIHMAYVYNQFCQDNSFSDQRMKQFLKNEQYFFTENAIITLPHTSFNKSEEMRKMVVKGIFPYPARLGRTRKAKGIKLKFLLTIRCLLSHQPFYNMFYWTEKLLDILRLQLQLGRSQ